MLAFGFLSAALLLGCFGPLEFLSATLLLGCPSSFGPLEFFLSAALLVAVAVGSLIAFCWFCWWFVFSTTLSLPSERRPGSGSSIHCSMGSESAVTSRLASFKTASRTRELRAATSAS